MEEALTLAELRVLAAVLDAIERLDPAGARANQFAVGLVGRLKFLPTVEPAAPYREQAPPSELISAQEWAEHRAFAAEVLREPPRLQTAIRLVERDDARAIIFAIVYEAATHCAINRGEAEVLHMLEEEWQLTFE